MPATYTNGWEFSVTSTEDTCVELPAPPRGEVTRIVLKQLDGSLDGFTANLLDRRDACAAEAEVSNSFEGETPETANKLLDPELHRIMAEISIAAASDLFENYNLAAGYQNRDEQDVRRTPNSRIYLDLNAAGSGVKRFQIGYSIVPAENI